MNTVGVKNRLTVCFFVLPLAVAIAVFMVMPIAHAALMSVQYWHMARPSPDGNYFLGFKNYTDVLSDPFFYNSLFITVVYIVVTVSMRFLLGFIAALLLNAKFFGRGIARSLIIIPWAVPEVVACLVFILMYNRDFGIINYLLVNMSLLSNNIAFLQDTQYALPAAMAVNIWKGFPFVAIMLLAGLQSIPHELYEAATVDGANFLKKTIRITIPSLKPVALIVFLLLVIWTIKDFAIAFLLARGGPSRATEILTIYVYNLAFRSFRFGEAAATGMIMLIFSLIFTSTYLKTLNKGEGKI